MNDLSDPDTPSTPDPSQARALPALWEGVTAVVGDGLWLLAADGSVRFSEQWFHLLGELPEPEPTLETWFGRIHPSDRSRLDQDLTALRAGDLDTLHARFRIRDRDGTYVTAETRATRSRAGGERVVIGSMTVPKVPATTDPLTGLPNRIMLIDRLRHALVRYRRDPSRTFAVLFLDLNNFKVTNDSLGHQIGDLLLVEMTKRLLLCVRSGDTVARLGGDEFVVLLEDVEDSESLDRIVGRIQRYTSSTFNLAGYEVMSSAAIGVVSDIGPYLSTDEILRDADIAMYHAKQSGRSSAYFDLSMYQRASRRQQLEVDLRQGIERGELFLLYQPIVDFRSDRIAGFEALIRWRHPSEGLIPPEVFVPIAEETGLINPLGEWVLLEVCRKLAEGDVVSGANDDFYVSVNLSNRQLARGEFIDQVAEILAETRVDASRLVLEVTESDLMEDRSAAAEALTSLKALGLRIALDDFGTGYSSLSYLHSLPLDILKIDGSFVRRLETDPKSVEIVRTFVELARSLRLTAVSEGVETPTQVSILRGLDCTHAQGFYYAHPGTLPPTPVDSSI